jgi:hypothetical protein
VYGVSDTMFGVAPKYHTHNLRDFCDVYFGQLSLEYNSVMCVFSELLNG